MRLTKLLPFIAVAGIVVGCLLPWMTVESKNLTISGIDTAGTNFGKPGYFHFVWVALYLFFLWINKVWSKRAALGIAGFNIAWALRNFFLLPTCQMGECPVRKAGLYILLLSSLLLFTAVLFYDTGKATAEGRRIN